MIKKSFDIVIETNCEKMGTLRFPEENVTAFEFMEAGYLYIQEKDDVAEDKEDPRVVVTFKRHWIPTHTIKKIDVHQTVLIEGEMEVLKYHKFMSRGIDMAHTAVSQTVVDPNKVAQEVEKDAHVRILKEKQARQANKQGKGSKKRKK